MKNKRRDKFFLWLKNQEIDFEAEELEENWAYIENRILANVASSIWGKEYLYKKLLDTDKQAQEALIHFDEAKALIGAIYSKDPSSE